MLEHMGSSVSDPLVLSQTSSTKFPEYWLSTLKVATIVIFIILGVAVNCGANQAHHYIGGEYWRLPGAPFVGGFGGFARVFVTASFACETNVFLFSALC
jgi:amino acid permease